MKCGVSPSRVSLLVIVSAYLRALTTRQLHVHVPTTLFVIVSLIFQTPDVVAQEDVRVLILSAADSPSSIVIYEWYIVAALIAVLVQTSLIIWLLFTRTRSRQVETGSEKNPALLAAEQKRFDEIVSNVPGIVCESRTDPSTGTSRTTFVSDYADKMLGDNPNERLLKPEFALDITQQKVSGRGKR